MPVAVSKEQMIEDLKRFIKENGKAPDENDCRYCDYMKGYSTYFHKFGTMKEALRIAGHEGIKKFRKSPNLSNGRYPSGRNRPTSCRAKYGIHKIIEDVLQAEEIRDKVIMLRKLRNLKRFIGTKEYEKAHYQEIKVVNNILNKYSKILLHIKL